MWSENRYRFQFETLAKLLPRLQPFRTISVRNNEPYWQTRVDLGLSSDLSSGPSDADCMAASAQPTARTVHSIRQFSAQISLMISVRHQNSNIIIDQCLTYEWLRVKSYAKLAQNIIVVPKRQWFLGVNSEFWYVLGYFWVPFAQPIASKAHSSRGRKPCDRFKQLFNRCQTLIVLLLLPFYCPINGSETE